MMRTSRNGWIFVVAVLLAAMAVFMLLRRPRLECVMADGSILSVQRVSFGKHELLRPGNRYDDIKERILGKLPRSWTARFYTPPAPLRPGWTTSSPPVHTNQDALQIWITRRDPATGKFQNVGVNTGQLVDEHGCVFLCTAIGGEDPGLLPRVTGMANAERSSITWLTFESFPRHAKTLRLRLFDERSDVAMGEFILPNPAPAPKPPSNWKLEPLPICRTNGEIVYSLKALNAVTDWQFRASHSNQFQGAMELEPGFEVRTNGQVAPGWVLGDLEATDWEGNFAPRPGRLPIFLCRESPAWRLVVKFFGPDTPHPASNATWTLKGVKLPEAGEFTEVNQERKLKGVALKIIALAGRGKVTYENGVVTQAEKVEGLEAGRSSSRGSADGSRYDISTAAPHLGLQLGEIKPEQWLMISATDDLGHRIEVQASGVSSIGRPTAFAYQSRLRLSRPSTRTMQFPTLDIPAGAKAVDLTITLEEAHMEEFVFKPEASRDKP